MRGYRSTDRTLVFGTSNVGSNPTIPVFQQQHPYRSLLAYSSSYKKIPQSCADFRFNSNSLNLNRFSYSAPFNPDEESREIDWMLLHWSPVSLKRNLFLTSCRFVTGRFTFTFNLEA
jgi:hypothetical protein